jgi:hypothetical protein
MEVTAEQRRYARIAGVMILAHFLLEMGGDYPTILARAGESFAQTSRYVTENELLWRTALLSVGIAWIAVAVLGFVLYGVVLEPVQTRLAQLALLLRLGGAFVGGACLVFHVAKERLQTATGSPLALLAPRTRRLWCLYFDFAGGGSDGKLRVPCVRWHAQGIPRYESSRGARNGAVAHHQGYPAAGMHRLPS